MFPKINVFLGLPLAEEGLRKSLRGSSWIGLHHLQGFSQPKRFHQILFHRFRIISLYAQAGIFPRSCQRPRAPSKGTNWDFYGYSQGTCLEFCFWPFLLAVKAFPRARRVFPLAQTELKSSCSAQAPVSSESQPFPTAPALIPMI